MKDYKTRIVDNILKEKLESKGAVVIEGPKWCGKTTTANVRKPLIFKGFLFWHILLIPGLQSIKFYIRKVISRKQFSMRVATADFRSYK